MCWLTVWCTGWSDLLLFAFDQSLLCILWVAKDLKSLFQVDAQIDLSLRWVQRSFCRVLAHIYSRQFIIFELEHDKTSKIICALSEDSNQPGHLRSLIRIFFAVSLKIYIRVYTCNGKFVLFQIIHRYIRARSVYLSDNLVAKVGDFDFAILDDDNTSDDGSGRVSNSGTVLICKTGCI